MNRTAIVTKESYDASEGQASTNIDFLHPVYIAPLQGSGIPLENRINNLIKRTIDIVFSALLLLILLPTLFPFIALLIKCTSDGPIFFLQKRYKKDGALFTCIKFRTMKHCDASRSQTACVTSAGAFLRMHHLDELPQLFNVLIGDMSLIGPRPHMISDTRRFEQVLHNYHFRHCVKPGITGLAQVSGFVGPITSLEKLQGRMDKDREYIDHWSLWLDLKIAFKTLLHIVHTSGQE